MSLGYCGLGCINLAPLLFLIGCAGVMVGILYLTDKDFPRKIKEWLGKC